MKKICLLLISVLIFSCSGFQFKQKTFFTRTENEILEKTTKEIGFRKGYNSKIDINYVFILSGEKQQNKNFNSILKEYDDKTLFAYYLKIYQLFEMTNYLTDHYKKTKSWKNYNMMRLELQPAMLMYYELLDAYYKSNRTAIYNDLQLQKPDIIITSILYYQEKNNIVGEY
ncbi:MAG: hypothetical protein JW982_08340 [Spirochaetes bacterium]|nr:hypothetical protein [Spirochaetota bacterium]